MEENGLTYDILKEMFNISAGKAAEMLSEITNKRILLDVPNIKLANLDGEKFEMNEYFKEIPEGALMVSSINFGNQIEGKANLLFPANKARRFLNLCMGEEFESNNDDMNFTDMDFDVIREVGNIILNSIIGGMGNFLNTGLTYTLPEVEVFEKSIFTQTAIGKEEFCMIVLYITFIIEDAEIAGAVVIDLTLYSLNELINLIKRVEDDLYE